MKRIVAFQSLLVLLPLLLVLSMPAAGAASQPMVVQSHGLDLSQVAAEAGEAASAPVISVWYGTTQHFGLPGNPQRQINILGNVQNASTLHYSLNGGPDLPLTIGWAPSAAADPSGGTGIDPHDLDVETLVGLNAAGNLRLASTGDFNVEIDRADLQSGANTVVIKANGGAVTQAVTVNYHTGNTWPLPYSIDWSAVADLRDVAQPVDGQWRHRTEGVRNLDAGYDRILAIGDVAWEDFEVVVPITIHEFVEPNAGGVGVAARWQGHFVVGSEQPGTGWWKLGAYAFYRNRDAAHGGPKLVMYTSHYDPLLDRSGFTLQLNKPYYYKMRVQTKTPGLSGFYSFKVWEVGKPEPSTWTFEVQDAPPDELFSGSVLFVAHKARATFGDVTIVPVVDVNVSTVGQGSVQVEPKPAGVSGAYLYGDTITLTATPKAGWAFAGWSGDLTGSENPATLTLSDDADITATFTQDEYDVTVTVAPPGSGTANHTPGNPYLHGQVATLQPVPQTNWGFNSWSGANGGEVTDNGDGSWSLVVDGPKAVTANFKQGSYYVDVTIDGQGSVGNAPGNPYQASEVATLAPSADPHWSFDDWSGPSVDDLVDNHNGTWSLTMDEDKQLTASFTPDQHTLTIGSDGHGSVGVAPDKPSYDYGEMVTLTPLPNAAWSFSSWSGPSASDPANNGDGTWSLVMDGDKSLTANHVRSVYEVFVSVEPSGGGAVAHSPGNPYLYGQTATLQPVPAEHYTFLGEWTGPNAGDLVDNHNGTWSLAVNSDKYVTANFAPDPHTLTIGFTGSGTVSQIPPPPYYYGDVVKLIPLPGAGWSFDNWTGTNAGDVVDNLDGTWSLTMDGDKSLIANFVEGAFTLTVSTAGQGTVTVDPLQASYDFGDVVTLTANPDPNWTFGHWSGDLQGSANPETIVMVADRSVTAHFYSGEAGPLVYAGQAIDDDNSGGSSGNGDGIVDCGETIGIYVDLYNLGNQAATGVEATINSTDPYLTWTGSRTSEYPDIPSGGTGTSDDAFSFVMDASTPNGHTLAFDLEMAADNGGPWSDSFEIPVLCAGRVETLTRSVTATPDDAEEKNATGSVALGGYDLELVDDGGLQTVGIRFRDLTVPQGGNVVEAYIEFTADEEHSGPTHLLFQGQASDDAPTFTKTKHDISGRARTASGVAWDNVPPWTSVGGVHQTPDLSPVVQEIVDRGGWAPGNSLAFIITGSGRRTAKSYDGKPAKAPRLYVTYGEQPSCFTLITYAVPSDSGSVTADPAPNCGPDQYLPGTQIQLTATAASGWTFSRWSGYLSGTGNPAIFTLDANRSVTANFVQSAAWRAYLPLVVRDLQ